MRSRLIYTVVICLLTESFISAQQGEPLFKQHCAVCHQIGNGKLVGPDLEDIHDKRSTEWLINFIRSSQNMIKEGDPEAVAIYNEYNQALMPDFKHLSDPQINAILNYIRAQSKQELVTETAGQDTITSSESAAPPTARATEQQFIVPVTHESIKAGRQLFTGRKRLANGGPSCIACHNVNDKQTIINGGNYAIDMTDIIHIRGSAAVRSMIVNPPFPAMQKSFENRPVTEEEANLITAYLISLSDDQSTRSFATWDEHFLWWLWSGMDDFGLLMAALCLLMLLLAMATMVFWPGRKSGSVNDRIYQRQIDSV